MKIINWILVLIVVITLVIVVKTVVFGANQLDEFNDNNNFDKTNLEQKLQRFSGGIKIPTVSDRDIAKMNFAAFDQFKKYLRTSYPIVFKNTEFEEVNKYGLVFKWKGKTDKEPILFLSHYDVVAPGGAEEKYANEMIFDLDNVENQAPTKVSEQWSHSPFSGNVTNGRIYGRGTLDMKGMLFAVLEASEDLMEQGFIPERDIYFAFGYDEETGGLNGATNIAKYFNDKGLRFDAVYDEGGAMPMITKGGKTYALALVGVAEKGFLTLQLNVKGQGGHSSMPPAKSALGQAGIVMQRLEQNQMPAKIIPPMKEVLKTVSGNLSFGKRAAIANQWLFEPILTSALSKNNITNALIRTTTALTKAKGSDGDNVLPPVAEITVNFRILPGDTVESVINHVKEVCKDIDMDIVVINAREPSNMSSTDTQAFRLMTEGLKEIYPDAAISPYITVAGTDAYKYELVSNNVYRFQPITMTMVENTSVHNYDESISIKNYINMISYFRYLMENYR